MVREKRMSRICYRFLQLNGRRWVPLTELENFGENRSGMNWKEKVLSLLLVILSIEMVGCPRVFHLSI